MNEEDGAGGAEGMPDISGVDGFVGNDDEEEEQDARAQDAHRRGEERTECVMCDADYHEPVSCAALHRGR